MGIPLLKIVLTATLIAAASLAGRRWGPAVSGWLIGLPLTSGPIVFFLALEHGTTFAAAAATGTLAGTISQATFCVVYGFCAPRGPWALALLGGCGAFLVTTGALIGVSLAAPVMFALALAALAGALWLMSAIGRSAIGRSAIGRSAVGRSAVGRSAVGRSAVGRVAGASPDGRKRPVPGALDPVGDAGAPPRWDLPARMVVATGFVLLLTEISAALGPHVTGLLAPFPVYGSVLAVFAQRQRGPAAAINVLRGLLYGLFSFAGFMLTLAELLERVGTAAAFAVAIVVALSVQGVSLWLIRRAAVSRPPRSDRRRDRQPVPSRPRRPLDPHA